MDIIRYQQDRDQDLAVFNKEYKEAKVQYVNMLNQAMHEQEPSKQAALVKQVLSLNSGLALYVREFVSQSRGKFDTAMLDKLTKDILQYQQDFQKIQTSSDKSQTLRGILHKEQDELAALQSTFDFWLFVLLGAIALVLILIFRTSLVQLSKTAESLVSDTSTEEMELPLEEPDEPLYKISLA